jgi:manganese/iron transport system permease protein
MAELLAPLAYPFMQRALLAIVLVGVLCAVVGSYVVLRGLAFIGEALRHGMFAGTVLAFVLGGSLLLGSLLAALLTAYLIQLVGRERRVGEGTAIGVLYTGAFALGVVLLGFAETGVRDLSRILLGDVLGIDTSDLLIVAAVTALTLGTVVYLYKELQIAAFDPDAARALGLPVGKINGLLFLLIAGALTSAYVAVGNLLAVALLLVPAATARLLARRLPTMMLVATGLAVGTGAAGLWLSFYLKAPSGPTIVLLSVAIFLLTLSVTTWRSSQRVSRRG